MNQLESNSSTKPCSGNQKRDFRNVEHVFGESESVKFFIADPVARYKHFIFMLISIFGLLFISKQTLAQSWDNFGTGHDNVLFNAYGGNSKLSCG